MGILATPLGWLMKLCYTLIKNYGIALLIFTFITRIVVFPLNIKQQKSTARMSMLSPQLEKIKKKYANNKEKLNEETMKLYQKENINPMASCLPMVITLVILWAMIPVIYSPLTYVSDAKKSDVETSNTLITDLYVSSSEMKKNDTSFEKLLKENDNDWDKIKKVLSDSDKYPKTNKNIDSDSKWYELEKAVEKHSNIDEFMNSGEISANLAETRPELVTFDFIHKGLKDKGEFADILPESVRKAAEDFNYEVFGLSLGIIPKWNDLSVLIPVISAVLQLACTIISQRYSKKNNPAAANLGGGMKIMFYAMPLFSLWIGFSYPAGLGLYWIYSSLFALIQTIVLNKVYTPERVQEMVKKDMDKYRKKNKKPSLMERAMAAQNQQNPAAENNDSDDDNDDDGEEKKLSKSEIKELQRQKINEARRRMAEKYGDEYDEKE